MTDPSSAEFPFTVLLDNGDGAKLLWTSNTTSRGTSALHTTVQTWGTSHARTLSASSHCIGNRPCEPHAPIGQSRQTCTGTGAYMAKPKNQSAPANARVDRQILVRQIGLEMVPSSGGVAPSRLQERRQNGVSCAAANLHLAQSCGLSPLLM